MNGNECCLHGEGSGVCISKKMLSPSGDTTMKTNLVELWKSRERTVNRKVVERKGWKRRYMYGLVRGGDWCRADQAQGAQRCLFGGGRRRDGCKVTRGFGREWSVPLDVAPLHNLRFEDEGGEFDAARREKSGVESGGEVVVL